MNAGSWIALTLTSLAMVVGRSVAESTPADFLNNSSLHRAALAGDEREVERLLATGSDPRSTNRAGATPLHYGAGDPRVVKVLLRAGADPNARSAAGATPLHVAAARPRSGNAVRQLLDAGAEVDLRRGAGGGGQLTPLTLAISAGNESAAGLLLERGASPGGTNGYTPVAAAITVGNEQILRALLARGGSVNYDDGFTGHGLNTALYSGHRSLVPLLLEHGSDLHQTSSFGERVPPMVWSAYTETGDTSVTRWLVERGLDVNEPTSAGSTALRWAMRRGQSPLTDYLRTLGAQDGPGVLKHKEIPNHPVPTNPEDRERAIREAVQKAISLLQRSSDAFLDNGFVREARCVSCHQQTLPAVAFGRARTRGLFVDEASLARQVRAQHASWSRRQDAAYEMVEPQPDAPANLGYGLRGLHALNYQPDELTAAMVWYLASAQLEDGSWPAYDRRPPMEEGRIVGTALAVEALRLFPQPVNDPQLARRFREARRWLERARPEDLNQEAFRLLGLRSAGAKPADLKQEVRRLLAKQRPDGGWAPLPGLASDAWATGQTLVALHEAGGVPVNHPAYRRGMDFLLRTQFTDGSWWVASRTWPFQPHFDSQFPHGKDQWISAGGTAWAALALMNELGPTALANSFPSAQTLISRYSQPESEVTATPGAVATGLDFIRDIRPILQRSCVECHQGAKPKGKFLADSRDGLLKGGQSGERAVIPGQPERSPLLRYVSDQVEDLEMPPLARRTKYPPLTAEERQTLRNWIAAGAP